MIKLRKSNASGIGDGFPEIRGHDPELFTRATNGSHSVRMRRTRFQLCDVNCLMRRVIKGEFGSCPPISREAGFTFIELMMVVLIIGVLAAVIVPRVVKRGEDARIAAARADIEAMSLALDLYKIDNQKYPSTSQGLEALNKQPTTFPIPPNWKGPYFKKNPDFKDPWGNKYGYVSPGVHNQDYDVSSYGPDGQDGGGDDIENWKEE